MCDICGSNSHETPSLSGITEVVRDGVNKEIEAKIRAVALDKALSKMPNDPSDWKAAGGTREVIKRAVVFMDFLNGDIASRDQVEE